MAASDSSTPSAELTSANKWTREELAIAQRTGLQVETVTAGLNGKIVEVRENDVVLQLPFPGRAYIRLSDLKTQPPRRYEPGQRVRTPFGKGVVRAFRYRPETVAGCDYVVDLIENRMSGWTPAEPKVAVGYMNAADVQLRSEADRTADECIADSDVLREKGNTAFKANDYETAVVEYNRSIEVLSGYRGRKLDVETRRRFMDCFLKSVGNTAQGMLKLPVPDNMQVVQLTSEAMQMDGEDEFKQRGKNLRRRGIALYNLGQWAMAAQDLRDAMATDKAFASDKLTRETYEAARDKAKKAAAKEKKTWQGAFAKMSGDGAAPASPAAAASPAAGGAGAGAGATASPAAPAAAAAAGGQGKGNGVRFVSPEAAASGSGRAGASASEDGVSPDRLPNKSQRTLFAGHTPHPSRSRRAAAAAEDDEEEEGADGGQDAGSEEGGFAAGGTATTEDEEEEEGEDVKGGSLWPWVVGAGVAAAGLGALYMMTRKRR